MSFIRYRQPILTRLSPHQGNRQYMVPNVPPLGPELVPDPYFRTWTDPARPDGWLAINISAGQTIQEGAAGGLRIIADVSGFNPGIQKLNFLELETCYLVQWRYSVKDTADVVLSGAFSRTLTGPVDVLQTLDNCLTGDTFASLNVVTDGSAQDNTLQYLSIRKVQRK